MGQQQILLISVGIILVMVAVVAGLNIANSQAIQANRDAISMHLNAIASIARSHYNRPKSMGGGGETFANFKIPEAMQKTENGTYEHTHTGHGTDHIHFTGWGTEIGDNEKDVVKVEIRITIDETKLSIKN